MFFELIFLGIFLGNFLLGIFENRIGKQALCREVGHKAYKGKHRNFKEGDIGNKVCEVDYNK